MTQHWMELQRSVDVVSPLRPGFGLENSSESRSLGMNSSSTFLGRKIETLWMLFGSYLLLIESHVFGVVFL